MKNPVLRALEFNHWATQKMVSWLEEQDINILSTPAANSFSSLRATIDHIYKAEAGWMNRLKGIKHPFPKSDESISNNDLMNLWLSQSGILLEFGNSLSEADWQKTFSFTDGYGPALENTQEVILQHVCNHSSYHRGQLITMGYQLGLKNFPPSDLILFQRENQI